MRMSLLVGIIQGMLFGFITVDILRTNAWEFVFLVVVNAVLVTLHGGLVKREG